MTFRLGLTGSIGMGKSTTAALFAQEGVPVWDADATVHRLYAQDGAATKVVAALFPDVIEGGAVSRVKLREKIAKDPTFLDQLQNAVHPLVAQDRAAFLQRHREDIVLLDIPLLYETGAEYGCDAVVVVTTTPNIQRARVMARDGMTPAEFEMIVSRQMPDAEKRARADYIIETTTLDAARDAVRAICAEIRQKLAHA